MIKNHLLLILLLSFIPLSGYSQVVITKGTPYSVVNAPDKFYFHQNQEILGVKITEKEITIQKWSAEKLNFKSIRLYGDMPRGWELERVLEFNMRYYLFYSLWDKDAEAEQLFYREINFEEGIFEGKGERLLTVDGKITGPLAKGDSYRSEYQNKFDFHTSYDQSKLLIQYRLKPAIRKDSKSYDIIGMNVYTWDLAPVWKKEVEMPYTEKKMNNLDYTIDSEGNTYILTTVYEDHTTDIKKSRKGPANYHIELLRIHAHSGKIEATPISLADKFINKLWFYENANNDIVCAGFYNKGKVLANASGIMLFNVTKAGKVADMATYEIPVDVINLYESERSQRRNLKKDRKEGAEFEELELAEVILEDDGSLLLIGEQHYVKEHYLSNGRTTTITYTYHYDDLLATKIDSKGNLSWMRKLSKRQLGSKGKGGMSYKYMRMGDEHYFLFLDNVKNMKLSTNKEPVSHIDGRGGYLTAYTVHNTNGKVEKTSILNTRDIEGIKVSQLQSSRILPLQSGTFVFEAYKKKKEDIWVRVQLKR